MKTKVVIPKKGLQDSISKARATAHRVNRLNRFESKQYKVYGKETITPSEAMYLLEECNTNTGIAATNRRLESKSVAFILRELQNKEWFYEAADVKIDTNGQMIDGQHTVAAIVAYGKPTEVCLSVGCRTAARQKIDVSRKRQTAQRLRFSGQLGEVSNGQARYIHDVSLTVRRTISAPNGNAVDEGWMFERSLGYNDSAIVESYNDNKEAVDYFWNNKPTIKITFKTGILAALVKRFAHNSKEMKDFFNKMIDPSFKGGRGESNAPAILRELTQEIDYLKKNKYQMPADYTPRFEMRYWYRKALAALKAFDQNKSIRLNTLMKAK
jgi:hypothetical protein